MAVMKSRISKLEQDVGLGKPVPTTLVDLARFEAGHSGEREPIGLFSGSKQGSIFRRLPGESVDDLHRRARKEHPDVSVWVIGYDGD